MTEPILRLSGVTARKGKSTVLSVDELVIYRGETLALIGPNGSGKSTLLELLAFLLPPATGHIWFDGATIERPRPSLSVRRRVAVVFQTPLLTNTSVFNNVAMGLRLRGTPPSEVKARVSKWLDRFGVPHLRDRSARALSGGEAQRVSLARAFAIEPDVLLLDEPLASLDAPTRAELLEDLERILGETDVTAVLVTHDRDEALALGDRIAVLIDGRVCQVDEPEAVFNAPANEEVASFVGVETIVPGKVERKLDDITGVRVGEVEVQVVGRYDIGDEVVIFLRPEHIVLSRADRPMAASSMRNNLPGVVKKLSLTGSQYRVLVDCGFPLVSLITRQSRLDLELMPEMPVVVSFKASAVHVLRRSDRRQCGAANRPGQDESCPHSSQTVTRERSERV